MLYGKYVFVRIILRDESLFKNFAETRKTNEPRTNEYDVYPLTMFALTLLLSAFVVVWGSSNTTDDVGPSTTPVREIRGCNTRGATSPGPRGRLRFPARAPNHSPFSEQSPVSATGGTQHSLLSATPTPDHEVPRSEWSTSRFSSGSQPPLSGVADSTLRLQLLQKVPLIARLSLSDQSMVAAALVQKEWAPGETVIKQGDIGREFFLIKEGQATVIIGQTEVANWAGSGGGRYRKDAIRIHTVFLLALLSSQFFSSQFFSLPYNSCCLLVCE